MASWGSAVSHFPARRTKPRGHHSNGSPRNEADAEFFADFQNAVALRAAFHERILALDRSHSESEELADGLLAGVDVPATLLLTEGAVRIFVRSRRTDLVEPSCEAVPQFEGR